MSAWSRIATWIRGWFGREPDALLGEELRFHLDMEAANLERQGLPPDAARLEARRRLGGFDRHHESLRDVRGGRAWDALRQDARYALRITRRFPGFAAVVVLTLGIAIGANTAIFSVVDAVLLQPLPLPDGDRLVLLFSQNPDKSLPRFSVSYADFLDWRKDTRSFAGMSAYTTASMTLLTDQEPIRLAGVAATSDFFDVLRARPYLGRLFHGNERDADAANEVVLSYGFWQRQYAGDSSIVGKNIKVGTNGASRTVIGVLPRDFNVDGRTIDAVIVLDPATIPGVENHGQHMLTVVGRLKPGVTLPAAQQDLSAVADRLAASYPAIKGWSANVFFLRDELVRTLRGPLLILLAAAGLVLLIGCINVANLLMTRASVREREVALRQALGAARSRLVSQLLVESGFLAIAGAAVGLAIGRSMLGMILRSAPAGLLPASVDLDAGVLGFSLAVAAATTLGVGLWPALVTTRMTRASALREGGRSSSAGTRALRARRSLVIAETSLALVLLVCAGLVVQSLSRLLGVDPGFKADNVTTMRITLAAPRYRDTTQVQFFRELQSRLGGRAGVEASGAANTPPISGGGIVTGLYVMGGSRSAVEPMMTPVTAVTPGYFGTMRMRLLAGRDVSWDDPRPTIVVSQTAATAMWAGMSPIGKRIAFGSKDTLGFEVVGVVNDARARGLGADVLPMVYLSYPGATSVARTMSLVVRGRGDLASMTATVKQAVHEIDATLPVYSPQPVADLIGQSLGQPRLNTELLTTFAVVALILSVIGLYGVISYSVTQRTQEIGVRVALGAQPRDVVGLVLREGAALAAVGVVLGIVGALFAAPLIRSWLFGIGPTDVTTIAVTAFGLVGVGMAASYLPARRAARIDPLIAMRRD